MVDSHAILYLLVGLASYLLARKARYIGYVLRVQDRPDGGRKLHRRSTPLVGGIAITIPALFAFVWIYLDQGYLPRVYQWIVFATTATFLLGFFDDRKHIRAIFRLAISIGIVAAALWFEPDLIVRNLQLTSAEGTYELHELAFAFTLLGLVGLQNAVNMADGKNGIVMGMLIIWSLVLLPYASGEVFVALVALLCCLVVVIPFNLDSRLFLGDSGAYALSIYVGFLTIVLYNNGYTLPSGDTVLLLYMVPVLDCLRLMISRMVKGRSPFSADRTHLHHFIYDLMPWRYGLLVYLSLVGGPVVAVNAEPRFLPYALSLQFAAYIGILFVHFIQRKQAEHHAALQAALEKNEIPKDGKLQ